MKRLIYLLAALALLLSTVTPVGALDDEMRVRLYTADGGMGAGCTSYTKDANLMDGVVNGTGPDCGGNWNNTIESLSFNTPNGRCWAFFTSIGYAGTKYVFWSDGFYELPPSMDNDFGSFYAGWFSETGICVDLS